MDGDDGWTARRARMQRRVGRGRGCRCRSGRLRRRTTALAGATHGKRGDGRTDGGKAQSQRAQGGGAALGQWGRERGSRGREERRKRRDQRTSQRTHTTSHRFRPINDCKPVGEMGVGDPRPPLGLPPATHGMMCVRVRAVCCVVLLLLFLVVVVLCYLFVVFAVVIE